MPCDMPTTARKNSTKRSCPVCQHFTVGQLLHTQTFTLPENHLLPSRYDIVACESCGFVYADTPATQDIYDRYYAEMSKYNMHPPSAENPLYRDRADWITSFIHDRADSVIDVGCGNGQLLLHLQNSGLIDLTGLDPSQECISNLSQKGIHAVAGSIFTNPTTRRYECAILSGVLEHICDVRRIMEMMKEIIKQGGLLFVCVPDASRYKDFDSVPFDYFNTEHINHFDEISLLNLGLIHGFRIISLLKTTITFFRTTQPMIFCVYQNKAVPSTHWLSYSRQSVLEYIYYTRQPAGIQDIITKLAESGEEIVLWGAGNYTSRLLAGCGLGRCNITMIVDSDRNKQGTLIDGRLIHPPSALREMKNNRTIIVAAAVLGEEIIAEIRRMGLSNHIIPLGKVNEPLD